MHKHELQRANIKIGDSFKLKLLHKLGDLSICVNKSRIQGFNYDGMNSSLTHKWRPVYNRCNVSKLKV